MLQASMLLRHSVGLQHMAELLPQNTDMQARDVRQIALLTTSVLTAALVISGATYLVSTVPSTVTCPTTTT